MAHHHNRRPAKAEPKFLDGIFSVPDIEDNALSRLETELSRNLDTFLTQSKVAGEIPLGELVKKYSSFEMPEEPCYVSEQVDFLLKDVIPYCVHTGSPKFIGHMTSAIPYFLQSLSKCMVALHQNTVKIETSRSFTFLERETLAMLHRLIYHREPSFYHRHMHARTSTLGIQCSGGTLANIMALWIARNRFMEKILGPNAQDMGLHEALQQSGFRNLCVFVSARGHYSLSKAADLLGIGKAQIISVPVKKDHRLDLKALNDMHRQKTEQGYFPLALVGIAGTTETGHVDPLNDCADFSQEHQMWFHVDAAWGGATLLSTQHRYLLDGIERSDSVVLDGHKQLYLPMGSGMLILNNPETASAIEHHTQYIIRESSFDLGQRHIEGSRAGMALLIHSALHIFGRKGYELIIDRNMRMIKIFAKMIEEHPAFELITQPHLNILTYRYIPTSLSPTSAWTLEELNAINRDLQKEQRERGQSFVSRTKFRHPEPHGITTTVLRVVIANPLTREHHLKDILAEQDIIGQQLVQKHLSSHPRQSLGDTPK